MQYVGTDVYQAGLRQRIQENAQRAHQDALVAWAFAQPPAAPYAAPPDEPYAAASTETAEALDAEARDPATHKRQQALARAAEVRHATFLRSGTTCDGPWSPVAPAPGAQRHRIWDLWP